MTFQSHSGEMAPGDLKALKSALVDQQPSPLPADSSDAAVAELHEMLLEFRNFTFALAKGDLTVNLGYAGAMANALKYLQANLRQLTLQNKESSPSDMVPKLEAISKIVSSINPVTEQLLAAKKQLEEANQMLQLRVDKDSLTGLYNHTFLMNTLENEIERSRRYVSPLSIVMLDIDHFKKINEIHGYRIGDAVLEEAAQLMCQILRPSDTAGRFGSGAFMLILPNTDCDGACTLAERIRSLIESTPFTESNIEITISAGIATCEKHKAGDLIQTADDRLHDAKSKGRNQVDGF